MSRPIIRACLALAFASAGVALSSTVAVADTTAPPGDIVVSTTTVTNLSGETLTTVDTKTYSTRGNLVRGSEITTNAAQETVASDVTTATYGGDGRYLSSTRTYDGDGDGVLPASITVTTASYDRTGFVTKIVTTVDNDSDGDVDSTDTQAFAKDRTNRTFITTLTLDGPSGGIVQTLESTLDARGNLILQVSFTDVLNPAGTDYRSFYSATYSNRQIVTSHAVNETLSPDGSSVAPRVDDATFTYDSRGNLAATTTVQDYDGVVGIDATYTSTQTYDNKDRVIRTESLSEATGEPAVLQVISFTYDAAGRVVAVSVLVYRDGVLSRSEFSTSTYDIKGRLLSNATASDDDGDGANDRTITDTYTYDGKGRLVEAVRESRDGSGSLTSSVRQTINYTRSTVTTTTVSDFNGDGIVDQTVVYTKPA